MGRAGIEPAKALFYPTRFLGYDHLIADAMLRLVYLGIAVRKVRAIALSSHINLSNYLGFHQ